MSRRKKIYEGKAKILRGARAGHADPVFQGRRDRVQREKKAVLEGKGVVNNHISGFIMQNLNAIGVPTHYIKTVNMREQLMREVEIIPLEVVCRNVAAGSIAKRLGIEEGTPLPRSIIEFYYKKDELQDPMVAEEHITAFNWASTQEIDDIMAMTLRINDYLFGMFGGVGSSWSISRSSTAASTRATWCAPCSPTRSAPTARGCGTWRPTKRWTRTASAATSATSPKPMPKLRAASES